MGIFCLTLGASAQLVAGLYQLIRSIPSQPGLARSSFPLSSFSVVRREAALLTLIRK
jgi:hypothetical protein